MILKSILEIGNELEEKGYDVFVEKQENGMFKCYVWHYQKCLGLGKIEYKDWKTARITTLKNIYSKIFGDVKTIL
jgi:hypothetical protein